MVQYSTIDGDPVRTIIQGIFSPNALTTCMLLCVGGLGGYLASLLHVPMPWLTGSLAATAVSLRHGAHRMPKGFQFPLRLRTIFIAVIGIMIGAQVRPELFDNLPLIGLSLGIMTLYVPIAHFFNYMIFRRLAGYSPETAYFAGAPGGLLESLLFGERFGADLKLLTLQQFLRIILVITTVPVAISIWVGAPVGSAAGIAAQLPEMKLPVWQMLPLVLFTGGAGAWLGSRLNLPASHLFGPLVTTVLINMTGWISLSLPAWLVVTAQVVIGVSLGMRFLNMAPVLVLRGLGLSAVSVSGMLGLGIFCALGLREVTGQPFDVLLISFSPGGVTEMSLIGLSLAANPALVTLHHVYRIFLTVALMGYGARLLPKSHSQP